MTEYYERLICLSVAERDELHERITNLTNLSGIGASREEIFLIINKHLSEAYWSGYRRAQHELRGDGEYNHRKETYTIPAKAFNRSY